MNVFKHKTWSLVTLLSLLASLLPSAIPPAQARATANPSSTPPLPAWFRTEPAAWQPNADLSSHLLPNWFAAPTPAKVAETAAGEKYLPGWFGGDRDSLSGPALAPPIRPAQRDIPLSLLTVDVSGPSVASLGSPAGYGETYTATIQNRSSDVAYSVYLTATHRPYFVHDGGDQLVSSGGPLLFNVTTTTTRITWTPVTTFNLAPGETLTLNFKLRATCGAKSGQQMRVGVRYNADPPPAPPDELNDGGLNVTTGRGNLVIKKEPAIQNLGTPDFGEPITWVVSVQNTGLGVLYDATITDTGGVNLGQPSGDLDPSITITRLGVNEVQTYTVVGRVEACNFTNVALGAWPCGNLVGDATVTNPLSSTVSVLFTPDVPDIEVQVSSPLTFSYCAAVTRTVEVTINSAGGPGGDFYLDSNLESDGFLEVIPASLSGDWTYIPASGVFSYTGGSPSGTIPALGTVTFTFQVRPQADHVCVQGSGQVLFEPHYKDVCTDSPFTADPVSLDYAAAQATAPTLEVSKSGPGSVASGEIFTYTVDVWGENPAQISDTVAVTDSLPGQFLLLDYVSVSAGTVTTTPTGLSWYFDPLDVPDTFSETLVYRVRAVVSDTLCGAGLIVHNDVEAVATPTCPGCAPLTAGADVETAIENNEGVIPGNSASGSFEGCDTGFTIANRYEVTGTTVVTWSGATFTEALGTPIGDGALPGPIYLSYAPGSLAVTVNGTDYTGLLTPTTSPGGQLVIDLSPLDAAGAPTQALTLQITYTVEVPEGALAGAVEQTFYDWSQLYLPSFSDLEGCAANDAFNQALRLTIGRGDLSIGLSPPILDKCGTNPVVIHVNDETPGRRTDHVVVTFTSSISEVASARNFAFAGSLASISPITVTTGTVGSRGLITFTLPPDADLEGDGEIRFDVDVNCTDEAPWDARVTYRSRCAVAYDDAAHLDHAYRAPNLILFATPIEYTVREKEVVWKFFLTNNGNLTATNVVVSNQLQGLSVVSYTTDSPGVSVSGTLPITAPDDVRFDVATLAPNQQRAVTVTAQVVACDPLHVEIIAEQGCFGTLCNRPRAEVQFNAPDPYLLTNNGETADLPMCDPGEVIFTTKNASADVTLYQLNITETLDGLAPIPGAPMTMTISDEDENVIATTTGFTPVQTVSGTQTLLVWRAVSATTEVLTWFNALPPLHVVRVRVPVRTFCVPPNIPRSFAQASALGPCGKQLGYTEDAVTLQTLQPDMTVLKEGKVAGGTFGDAVYAAPGQTVTWRIEVDNHNTSRSYVAHNVVLSDTWPPNFEFITATTGFSPTVVAARRTITWAIGDVAPPDNPLEFYITGTVAMTDSACGAATVNATRLTFGCDFDGCTSALVPQDTAQLGTQPDPAITVTPDPLQTCAGDIPITIRNDGAAAYSTTLTVTLPAGYVYSHTVSSGLTPTQIISTPGSAPRFLWDVIPGRTGSAPYEFTLLLRVQNSGSSGTCPVEDGRPVTGTLDFDNHPVCAAPVSSPVSDTVNLQVLTPILNVAKTPRTQPADVGQTITWTLSLTNTGAGLAEQVIVTDVVGSNYTNVTATLGSDGAVPVVSGETVTWVLAAPLADSGGVWSANVSAELLSVGDNRNVVTATAGCASGCQTALVTDTAFATLLQDFEKRPAIQTGTIGSLVRFTITANLPDQNALYANLTLTDALPAGLGYRDSLLTYTYDGDGSGSGPTTEISGTPTLTPGGFQSGDVVWRLGDLPGTVQLSGVITAVIQDAATNYDGVRLTNHLRMTYVDDGQPYVYTDSADVEVLEPILHLGKRHVTPYGCGAMLSALSHDFNDGTLGNWAAFGGGSHALVDGALRLRDSRDIQNVSAAVTDFSWSMMVRKPRGDEADILFAFRVGGGLNDSYVLRWHDDGAWTWQIDNGGADLIPDPNPAVPSEGPWHHLEIQMVGPRMRLFVDGERVVDAIDATAAHAGGNLRIHTTGGSDIYFDDLLVTRLGRAGCTVGAGDRVTYTLLVSNQGQLPGYDLTLTDTLPAGMALITYTAASDDPGTAVAAEPAPIPGATGDLVWGFDRLTPTAPFDPADHTALTLTVVLRVSDAITANTVLPNQAFLDYEAWPGGTQPTTVTRSYSGGSHSTAVRTVDGGMVKRMAIDPPPTATLGTLVTYTLVLPQPPITATLYDLLVTDTLDPRLRVESVTTTGGTGAASGWDGQLVTATFASIPHDTQAYVTVTARISHAWPSPAGDADAGDLITNTGVLTHPAATTITETKEVSTTVGEPRLTLVKASDPPTSSTVGANDLVTYAVTLTNSGGPDASPAYDLTFTDTLPAEMRDVAPTLLDVTLDGAPVAPGDYSSGYASPGGLFTLTFVPAFSLPVGGALLIEYVATVNDGVGAGLDLTNQARAGYSSLPGDVPGDRGYVTLTDTTTVHTVLPATVKAVTPLTATLGDVVTYIVRLPEPPLSATLYDVTVTDRLDSRLDLQSITDGPDGALTVAGNAFTLTYPAIPHGEQRWITVTALLSHPLGALAGDVITNRVTLAHSTGVTTSNRPPFTVTEPALTLIKASDPPTSSTVEAGDPVTYTVRVTNASGGTLSPAYDVALTDTLPGGMRAVVPALITLTLNGASIAPGDYVTGYNAASGVLTVTLAPTLGIPVGGAWVVGYVARVDSDVMGGIDLSNQAQVTWSSRAGAVAGDRDYPAVSDGTTVHTPPATGLDKRGKPPTVTIGSQVVYTVTVPEPIIGATIYNVVLTDVVDSRLRVDAVSANAAYSGQTVTATFASIPSLTQEIVVITATMRDLPSVVDGTQIINVAAFDYTSNPSDTLTSEPVTVTVREPDVPLFKSAQVPRDPLGAGDVVTYRLSLVNNGHWPAYDLTITDTLPPGLTFLTTLGFGITDPTTATLTGDYPAWSVDQLNPGGSLEITFTARLSDAIGAGLTLTNTAGGAYDNWPDEPPDEREYPIPTDTVPLETGYPALELSKSATPSPVEAGADLTYTLRVTNSGIVSATGVVISDRVPANTTFQSCSPNPCNEAGGVVSWTLDTLDVGAPRVVRMMVTVASGLSSGVITNSAWLTSSEGLTDTDTITTPLAFVSLGDLVWYDHDNDGLFEPGAGESGVASVTVALYRPGDVLGVTPPLSTTTTDGNGRYLFTGLDAGGYWAHIPSSAFGVGQPLEGYTSTVPTEPDPNTDQNEDVDENGLPDGAGVSSGIITLTYGAEPTGEDVLGIDPGTPDDHSNLTLDFGFYQPLSLGDLVWYDHDNDGVFEPGAGESGVAGVTVELYRPGDVPSTTVPLSSTVTDGNGRYLFTDLGEGGYLLHIPPDQFGPGQPLEGYESTVPTEPDPNSDANEDLDENGLPVTGGAAAIDGVSSGVVTLTIGAEPTGEDVLGIDPGTPDDNSNLTVDFGFFQPLSLGDLVWYDHDNDGLFEPGAGESGVASVTVALYRPGDVPSATVPLSSTSTDGNGRYLFTDLGEGGYFLHIPPDQFSSGQPLENYESTVPTEPDPNSDVNEDLDENGLPVTGGAAAIDGVSSGVVTLTIGAEPTGEDVDNIDSGTPDGNSNLTIDFGFFHLLSLGDLVWYDRDNDGVYEPGAGESGIAGVTVELYRPGDVPSATVPLSSTATDGNGRYLFTDLGEGGYFLHIPPDQFSSGQPLENYESTVPTEPDPNSDVNEDGDENGLPVTGGAAAVDGVSSGVVTLTIGAEPTGEDVLGIDSGTPDDHSNLTIDFGFYHLLSLGDLVWYDYDNDGLFEPGAGESGVAGVTVALYRPGDVLGVTPPLNSTTTDGNGRYLFTGLDAGGYWAHIPSSAFGVGQPLEGYTSTVPTEPDPNTDQNEDVDENGLPDGAGVSSGIITLTYGAEPTGEDVLGIDPGTPDDHSNLTLDFGFFLPTPGLEVTKAVLPQIGANGQILTYSVQVRNVGNVPLNPVQLEDTLPDGFRYADHARLYPPAGGVPLEPDLVAEPTLLWNDIASGAGLDPARSLTLTFQVTVATGVTGTFVNVVTATGTTPSGTISDTDEVPIPIEDPALEIDKQLVGHDRPQGIVTFTIHISNVGPSALDVLPLLDGYDPYYLSFIDAVPYPEEDADDGLLAWYDLTGPPPHGFGKDLLPNRQFVITTVFGVVHEITQTFNSVTVTNASDRHDNPADDDDDELPIVDIPTRIELLYLRASEQEGSLSVEWATLMEVDSHGFWLYRGVLDRFSEAVQLIFQSSQGAGGGAEYSYRDQEVEAGQRYWYWLIEVDNQGIETRYGPISAVAGSPEEMAYPVYLPLMIRR